MPDIEELPTTCRGLHQQTGGISLADQVQRTRSPFSTVSAVLWVAFGADKISWKMYLPQQWKDSGVSRKVMPGVMDPSMTLANATHNTSVILLHERIAYPDAELLSLNLPSHFSAENCLNAAIETANITTKYLGGYPSARAVPPQMGICAFVSARTLLGKISEYSYDQL